MKLTGSNAVGFLKSMQHPDEKQQEILSKIKSNIALRDIPNGYEADIKNLDMSFLKEK